MVPVISVSGGIFQGEMHSGGNDDMTRTYAKSKAYNTPQHQEKEGRTMTREKRANGANLNCQTR